MPLLVTLLISVFACYLVGRFSKNLFMVAALVAVLQIGGFIWVVETDGVFKSYSLVNCSIILCVTFLWYLVAAQFHLWVNSKDPASDTSTSKGQ